MIGILDRCTQKNNSFFLPINYNIIWYYYPLLIQVNKVRTPLSNLTGHLIDLLGDGDRVFHGRNGKFIVKASLQIIVKGFRRYRLKPRDNFESLQVIV